MPKTVTTVSLQAVGWGWDWWGWDWDFHFHCDCDCDELYSSLYAYNTCMSIHHGQNATTGPGAECT